MIPFCVVWILTVGVLGFVSGTVLGRTWTVGPVRGQCRGRVDPHVAWIKIGEQIRRNAIVLPILLDVTT